ncbi:unnamed protein product [Phytomonas sp. EM1]|nr:unnamed protein product [Phytomonas sp. EM1]|eukprot:CCW61403.1 unnamed protein product [Phytomonas sp. isolate EM1]
MLCAALAGSIARVISHPLETIKTVAFTGFAGNGPTPTGQGGIPHAATPFPPHSRATPLPRVTFFSSAKDIWRREGVAGFYRGVGISAIGAAPAMGLYLSSYDWCSARWRALGERPAPSSSSSDVVWSPWERAIRTVAANTPSAVTSLTCGFLAEAASCVVWVPMDVSKERLQSQPPSLEGRYRNSWDALRTIARYEGVYGLYRGYGSTLWSFGPFSAVYFFSYEIFSDLLTKLCYTNGAPTHLDNDPNNTDQRTRILIALGAGAGGNIMASLTTNPLEFVKTRLQVQRAILKGNKSPYYKYQYRGLYDGLVTAIKEEGVRGLWRGVGCRMAHAAPNAALAMAFYEYFKVKMGKA